MSPLREEVLMHMRLRGFSPKTVEVYIHALEELARFYKLPLETLSCEQVQKFLDHLISVKKLAWSTINVYFAAYRLLYTHLLKRSMHEFSIPPRGRSGKRPGILSTEEVRRLIEETPNIKHRAMLAMAYGSGLRISEVARIRIADIDRGRMMLRVQQSKGHKDRYTVLSAQALALLEKVWHKYRPREYFFSSPDGKRPISVHTISMVYHSALKRSGIRKVGGIHVLRHCFATHLLEAGADIYVIKRWMGHTAIVTTERYMHVTREHMAKVKSPLDGMKPAA